MLTKEQLEQLEYEGLTARIANLVTPIKLLFDLIGAYYNVKDRDKLNSSFGIIKDMEPRVKKSLEIMKDLAKEVGNKNLEYKLQALDPLLREYKWLVEEKREPLRKKKAYDFKSKDKEHDALINEIIKASEIK